MIGYWWLIEEDVLALPLLKWILGPPNIEGPKRNLKFSKPLATRNKKSFSSLKKNISRWLGVYTMENEDTNTD